MVVSLFPQLFLETIFMMNRSWLLISGLAVLLVVGGIFISSFPTGDDVARSLSARSKIEEVIARARVSERIDVNAVLMKEVHWGSAAVIRNPYPGVDRIYELISRSEELKDVRPLLLIFRDGNMKEMARRRLE